MSLSVLTIFNLEYILADNSITTPALFSMEYPFPSFSFNLFMSIGSKVSFCIHVIGSILLIHSSNLYLIITEFNAFKFKENTVWKDFCHCPLCFLCLIFFCLFLSSCIISFFVFNGYFLMYYFDSLFTSFSVYY